MNPKEFALTQIAPYYLDPNICGYKDCICEYFTSEGKMCVVGKNLVNAIDFRNSGGCASSLISNYGINIIKPESRHILSLEQWDNLQGIHDGIAQRDESKLVYNIEQLNLFSLDELIEYCHKLKNENNG